jgi:uncharacterized protein YegP (UPF0339 family)
MSTQRGFDGGRLYQLYAAYVGEPESRKDVYGYWLFLVGSVVSFLGVLVYIVASSPGDFLIREVSITMAAFGLPVALLGILLLLPVNRRGIQASVGGAAVALLAVGGFVSVYPGNWVVGTPDYSGTVIAVYTAGVALVVGVAALVPVVTGEKSFFFEQEYARGGEYPPAEIGEALESGLFSVYNDGDEWQWRLLEENALAGGADGFLSHLETEETVDTIKEMVAQAGLLEIKTAAFRLYETAEGRWRWLLVREDGSVVADSGGEFADRDGAAGSVNDLKDFGPDAELLSIEAAALDCYEEAGEWHWRLRDGDREVLATSPSGLPNEPTATAAMEEARGPAAVADTLAIEELGVELYAEGEATAADGGEPRDATRGSSDAPASDGGTEVAGAEAGGTEDWRWRLVDAAETELATDAGGFDARKTAESAVYDLLDAVGDAPVMDAGVPNYGVTPTGGGGWRWRLVENGTTLARSHGDESSADAAAAGARALRSGADEPELVVVDDADFEYFEAGDGWRWRLVTEDRETIAESGDSHDDRDAAAAAIAAIQNHAPDAELIEFENAAFQVYETDGEWRWRLIDEDGNVMTDSGQSHDDREGAMSSMMTVKENAPDAELLEIENAAFELFEEPAGWNWRLVDEGGETTARGVGPKPSKEAAREAMDRLVTNANARARPMTGPVFQLYASDDEWQWRFVQPDGTIVADAARTHATRDETEAAVEETVAPAAAAGDVHVIDPLAVQLRERGDRWSWRLLDRARDPVAESTPGYDSREAAVAAVERLQANAATTVVFGLDGPTYRLARREDGWRWTLLEGGRTELAAGPRAYDSREDAERAVAAVRELLPEAEISDFDVAAFELYADGEDGRWYWQLIDEAETVIAAGVQGHGSREAAAEAVEAVRAELEQASVLEIDTAAFELYEDAGEWRWRLVDENGNTLARSLRVHDSRREARETMDAVKEFAPEAVTQVAE